MILREILSDIVKPAFAACGYDAGFGEVTASNRPDLCQFQCNGAMAAAKIYKKAPIVIADEVAARLAGDSRFSAVTAVAPGFLNLSVSDAFLAEWMNRMKADGRMLLPLMEPRTIVVDYGGPNIAKPLHVGHLRAAIIGDALRRIALFLGHNVIGDTHLGDWGLQMGLVLAALEDKFPELSYFDQTYTGDYPAELPVTADDLNGIYPAASARAKTDAAFAARSAAVTADLQNHRSGYIALWQKIKAISLADLRKNYGLLGVHFDEWLGESDADPYVPRVMETLEARGLLRESNGAMVVDVALPGDTEPMPPMIVVKSNGADIYGTTDLGTLLQRREDWRPDEIWYVTDNRQIFHFKQLFRCAALMGLSDGICLEHIWFGTMNGKDGKPYKTREGGVMRLSDMIETVTGAALERAEASGVVAGPAARETVARAVGVAAMKIGDMVNHRTKDYVFDMDRFLAAEGKTGPYLQYAAVRLFSVLKKAEMMPKGEIALSGCDSERELMLALTAVPDALLRAFEDKTPNALCEVMFQLAGASNKFYFENRILTCPDEKQRASWLSLIDLTARMLTTLLSLLGIEVPESM